MGCAPAKLKYRQDVKIPSKTTFCKISAQDTRVQTVGRVVRGTHGLRFDWPGSRVVFKIPSWAADGMVVLRMDGADNFFNVYVNSDRYYVDEHQFIFGEAGFRDLVVFNGLNSGSSSRIKEGSDGIVISLSKRTEPYVNVLKNKPCTIDSIKVSLPKNEGGQTMELLELTSDEMERYASSKVIEFVGDGDTACVGVLGAKSATWNKATQDRSQDDLDVGWPSVVAEAFGVGLHCIACSSAGAVWGKDGEGSMANRYFQYCANDSLMGGKMMDDFDKVEAQIAAGISADRFDVGVTVVCLGKNDVPFPEGTDRNYPQLFQEGFVKLLRNIRAVRGPDVPILVMLPAAACISNCDGADDQNARYEPLSKLLPEAVAQAGDSKISVFEMNAELNVDSDDDWGYTMFWGLPAQRKLAQSVIPQIASLTGWAAHGSE
eukprot:TRINITY_DN63349_c0_g1_i1.p1 TRINITY_DN63349_c0_g1~~TRINITY_DN63349_c0_g1_i1.p1  ORF type:complete len:432 (+),score=58.91 TRINITY_DN63349_c0_g1_i1:87-1382(+)